MLPTPKFAGYPMNTRPNILARASTGLSELNKATSFGIFLASAATLAASSIASCAGVARKGRGV